jgi:hypothetical protein
MSISTMKSERLLTFYENVRHQVEQDIKSGFRHALAGNAVKQYAEQLREEMERRRLEFTPIDWGEVRPKSPLHTAASPTAGPLSPTYQHKLVLSQNRR